MTDAVPEVHVGRVTRMAGGRPVISVPTLAFGYEVTEVEVLDTVALFGRTGDDATVEEAGHRHEIEPTVGPGDRVLVVTLGGVRDHVAVVGRLR